MMHPECKSYKYPNKIFLYTISSNIGPVNTMTNTEIRFFQQHTVNIVFLLFLTTPKMFVKKFWKAQIKILQLNQDYNRVNKKPLF